MIFFCVVVRDFARETCRSFRGVTRKQKKISRIREKVPRPWQFQLTVVRLRFRYVQVSVTIRSSDSTLFGIPSILIICEE